MNETQSSATPTEESSPVSDTPDAPRRGALNLSREGDLEEAAANLFAMLRLLDNSGVRGIAVMPIPEIGLGRAINDRLRRAAAGGGKEN